MDAIAAMLSRNFPDPETQAQREEGRRHTRNFIQRFPHLAGLLKFDDRPVSYQGRTAHAVLIPADSKLPYIMRAFGARLGMALYRKQMGSPVPPGVRVEAQWFPNAHLDNDEAIEKLLRTMGQAQTLRLGRWEVGDQFRYWSAVPVDAPEVFCCFAAFRQSFGVLAVIDPENPRLDEKGVQTFETGFLQGFDV